MDHVDGWPFQVVLSGSETILRGSEVPMPCLSLQISGNFSLLARPANFSKDFGKSTPPPNLLPLHAEHPRYQRRFGPCSKCCTNLCSCGHVARESMDTLPRDGACRSERRADQAPREQQAASAPTNVAAHGAQGHRPRSDSAAGQWKHPWGCA